MTLMVLVSTASVGSLKVRSPAVAVPPAGLAISAPTSASGGTAARGDTVVISLGDVTVTTTGFAVGASWTATASTTGFSVSNGQQSYSIPLARTKYWSGLATASSGYGVTIPCTAGQLSSTLAVAMTSAVTAYSCGPNTDLTDGGATSLTWRPTIEVTTSPDDVSGTYTATIVHSVS